jgi:hypothetical protein
MRELRAMQRIHVEDFENAIETRGDKEPGRAEQGSLLIVL